MLRKVCVAVIACTWVTTASAACIPGNCPMQGVNDRLVKTGSINWIQSWSYDAAQGSLAAASQLQATNAHLVTANSHLTTIDQNIVKSVTALNAVQAAVTAQAADIKRIRDNSDTNTRDGTISSTALDMSTAFTSADALVGQYLASVHQNQVQFRAPNGGMYTTPEYGIGYDHLQMGGTPGKVSANAIFSSNGFLGVGNPNLRAIGEGAVTVGDYYNDGLPQDYGYINLALRATTMASYTGINDSLANVHEERTQLAALMADRNNAEGALLALKNIGASIQNLIGQMHKARYENALQSQMITGYLMYQMQKDAQEKTMAFYKDNTSIEKAKAELAMVSAAAAAAKANHKFWK